MLLIHLLMYLFIFFGVTDNFSMCLSLIHSQIYSNRDSLFIFIRDVHAGVLCSPIPVCPGCPLGFLYSVALGFPKRKPL